MPPDIQAYLETHGRTLERVYLNSPLYPYQSVIAGLAACVHEEVCAIEVSHLRLCYAGSDLCFGRSVNPLSNEDSMLLNQTIEAPPSL
ncbi:hypothetical protein PAPYR_13325 [Paratrimastix pyriformis]|uniref:Uncharacterized protein n=1 Tax=Paratrimastix pyriformis TaxID=342808 RepID=A0ABQ8U0G1_9EUKA|nr:hypothetical protein PAPYR_13325 [Paratrimastix pyriformis]